MSQVFRSTPPSQSGRSSGRIRPRRTTHADVLVALLRYARANGRAVELPDIMGAGIAQHEARFNELRAQGFVVVNETDRHDIVMRSRYRLTFDPEVELAR